MEKNADPAIITAEGAVLSLQPVYASLKNKSSLLVLLGCVALAALSYIAVSMAVPTSSNSSTLNIDDGASLNIDDAQYHLSPPASTVLGISPGDDDEADAAQYRTRLKEVFERAAMPNRTVIITTLNAAWAEEGAMVDLFLESFSRGVDTLHLVRHLVMVCVDDRAYQRCLAIHPHCTYIKTPGINFAGPQLLLSADYIKLMWRRIKFLHTVLEMDYSFVFTDTDVLWLRNPLPSLRSDTEADLQTACDFYNGRPGDVHNAPNTGFMYVRANARSLRFYEYWYEARKRDSSLADQGMLNAIKFDEEFRSIGMKLRFLDTQFFGGFCGLRYTDMARALTMHATCCKGQEAKLIDLHMILDGWTKWQAANLTMSSTAAVQNRRASSRGNRRRPRPTANLRFNWPVACPLSWHNQARVTDQAPAPSPR